MLNRLKNYFTKTELTLWSSSTVLIVLSFVILWISASMEDIRYISVVVCFTAFFVNDIYGFVSWRKMAIRQASQPLTTAHVDENTGLK